MPRYILAPNKKVANTTIFLLKSVQYDTTLCSVQYDTLGGENMDKIAEIIALVVESEENVEKAKAMVAELTDKYPLC